MKQISLSRIELMQFRSFTGRATIDLTTAPGLKLISGSNLAEPALGANGSGKSTLWDALCFALYGTSIKGLRASDLVSYGAKETTVAATLNISGRDYVITRYAPPARMFIDHRPAEQADIEALVGLSRARFLNSVVFGQAVPMFIDLPVPARGDLLDEVLQLQLWMDAADRATGHYSMKALGLATLQNEVARLTGNLEGLPNIADLTAREARWNEQHDADRAELAGKLRQAQHLEHGQPVNTTFIDLDTIRTKCEDQRSRIRVYAPEIGGLKARIADLKQSLEFFAEAKNCPTCGQEITPEFAAQHLRHLTAQYETFTADISQLNARLQTAEKKLAVYEAEWQGAHDRNAAVQRARAVLQERSLAAVREIRELKSRIKSLNAEINPYSDQKLYAMGEKKRLEAELAEKRRMEQEAVSELAGLNYWRGGFRKVRLFCLENVLQELSVETRNSLLALGLVDWRISFKTATETKSGSVKLGVQLDVQPPNRVSSRFDVLSGGEGQRARLAASLGLANLIQRWAGVRYGFAVFDEPTAWLSEQGVEDLLDNLAYKATAENKSVWLCDHRALQHSAFAETYLVEKSARGSRWLPV